MLLCSETKTFEFTSPLLVASCLFRFERQAPFQKVIIQVGFEVNATELIVQVGKLPLVAITLQVGWLVLKDFLDATREFDVPLEVNQGTPVDLNDGWVLAQQQV